MKTGGTFCAEAQRAAIISHPTPASLIRIAERAVLPRICPSWSSATMSLGRRLAESLCGRRSFEVNERRGSSLERIAEDERLIAAGPHRNDLHRDTGELDDAIEVSPRIGRQIFDPLGAGQLAEPGELFVDGLYGGKLHAARRHVIDGPFRRAIRDTDP